MEIQLFVKCSNCRKIQDHDPKMKRESIINEYGTEIVTFPCSYCGGIVNSNVYIASPPKTMVFKIESQTHKGKFYSVKITPFGIICPCKGFKYRNTCSHVKEVQEGFTQDGAENG